MKGLIYSVVLFFIACGTNNKEVKKVGIGSVTATCERIIVCDTLDYPSLNLVISFKNNTAKRVYMLMNRMYTGLSGIDEIYFNGGIMFETNDLVTPIGAINRSNLVKIEPDSVLKMFYIYSQLYPNEWKEFENNTEDLNGLMQLAKSFKLFYHYNDSAYLSIDKTDFLKDPKGYLLAEDIPILMNVKKIEHRCRITTDDIAEMVGGTVIIGDSLPKQPKLLPDDYFKPR